MYFLRKIAFAFSPLHINRRSNIRWSEGSVVPCTIQAERRRIYQPRLEKYLCSGEKDRFAFRQAAILFLLLSYGGVENRGLEYSGPDFHTQQFVKPTYQKIQNVRP